MIQDKDFQNPRIGSFIKQGLGNIDWFLFVIVVLICLMGIVFSYSSQILIFEGKVNPYDNYIRQMFYMISGLGIMLLIGFTNYRKIVEVSNILFYVAILVLIYTLISGTIVNKSKRWIDLGLISLQPSEFVKVVVIVYASRFLDRARKGAYFGLNMLLLLAWVAIPTILVGLQPDLGTSLVFLSVALMMLVVVGMSPKNFFLFFFSALLTVIGVFLFIFRDFYKADSIVIEILSNNQYVFLAVAGIFSSGLIFYFLYFKFANLLFRDISFFIGGLFFASVFSWGINDLILKDYQKERLLAFINPYEHRWDLGYNVIQSQTAIGSGGLFGKGLFNGVQGQLGFLPSRTNDFIFSVIGEELGFVGTVGTAFLFFLLLFRLGQIALQVKDDLGGLIVIGVFTMFALQIVVNLCMTIGLMPVTGIPLPFLSTGGSTLWSSLMAIGLVFSVYSRRHVNA